LVLALASLSGQDIIQDDLAVSKLLGQGIIKYRNLFPDVSAAIQLTNEYKQNKKKELVSYQVKSQSHAEFVNDLTDVVP
jgi:hypothetical protein